MNSRLQRELCILAIFGTLALLMSFLLLLPVTSWLQLLPALAVFAFQWQRLWQWRHLNRRDEQSPLLESLGLANRLTILRGWLIAVCAGYIWPADPSGYSAYAPALYYTLAALLDWLDGFIARRSNSVTLLGTQLDTSFDALGLLVAPVVAVAYGKLHPSYLLVSIAYYLFVWGLYWRRRHGLPVLPLRPSRYRRTLAGMQMGLVAVALWPVVDPALSQTFGTLFMLPLLAGFWTDWLVVSARA